MKRVWEGDGENEGNGESVGGMGEQDEGRDERGGGREERDERWKRKEQRSMLCVIHRRTSC